LSRWRWGEPLLLGNSERFRRWVGLPREVGLEFIELRDSGIKVINLVRNLLVLFDEEPFELNEL